MKKNLLVIVALLACTAFTTQAQLKFGLKAGVNINQPSIDLTSPMGGLSLDPDNYTGFQVGPIVEFIVPVVGIGFDTGILYSQTGYKSTNLEKISSNIYIPLNLRYKLNVLNVVGFYAAAGPYINFNLTDEPGKVDTLISDFENKSFGAGLGIGVGVEFLGKLQVGVNYQHGLTEDFSAKASILGQDVLKIDSKTRLWTISATYLF